MWMKTINKQEGQKLYLRNTSFRLLDNIFNQGAHDMHDLATDKVILLQPLARIGGWIWGLESGTCECSYLRIGKLASKPIWISTDLRKHIPHDGKIYIVGDGFTLSRSGWGWAGFIPCGISVPGSKCRQEIGGPSVGEPHHIILFRLCTLGDLQPFHPPIPRLIPITRLCNLHGHALENGDISFLQIHLKQLTMHLKSNKNAYKITYKNAFKIT